MKIRLALTVRRLGLMAAASIAIARFEGPALAVEHQNNLAKSSLSELFVRTLDPAHVQNTALIKRARSAKRHKHYPQATALFLSASTPALYHQKFLAAKPLLDEAMTLVPRLSVADQKQVLHVLDSMLKDLDNNGSMPDGTDKEYLAKNVLQIAKTMPEYTASQRADAIIRLSFIYSYHKRTHPREAEAMLVQLLSELKENSPADLKIDSCLEALVIAYEADEQIEYAAQCWDARAKFVRLHEPSKYSSVLERYALFLLKHKMFNPAIRVVNELRVVAFQSDQSTSPNQLDWENIAAGLQDVDADLSLTIDKVAYDYYTHASDAIKSYAYGSIALSWASTLSKQGKTQEAVSVMQNAIDFSRQNHDYTDLWMRRHLYDSCIRYLSIADRTQEAQAMTEQLRKDEKESAAQQVLADDRQLASTMADANAGACTKISELTKKAYRELDGHNCEEGLNVLNQALSLYEKYSSTDQDSCQYNSFLDVRRRLNDCGRNETAAEILWRIMTVKMKSGLDDREFPRCYSLCHLGPIPRTVDEELFPTRPAAPPNLAPDEDQKRLMALAKQSGKPANLIFALNRQLESETLLHPEQSHIELCEEIEQVRETVNSPTRLLFAKFATASEFVRQNRFADAMEKWRSALAIKGVNADRCTLSWSPFSHLSRTLGSALVKKNRLLDARQVFLEAYDRSFELGDHEYNKNDLKDVQELEWKYSELQDFPSAQSLLQRALKVAEAKGERGTMAKSDVYLALAQLNLARKRPAEAAAIFKNYQLAVKEMNVDVQHSTMQNGMREYARLLGAYGYHDESSKIIAQAELAEKAEKEKRATERAKIPATTSPSLVLTNLATIPDSQLHSDPH